MSNSTFTSTSYSSSDATSSLASEVSSSIATQVSSSVIGDAGDTTTTVEPSTTNITSTIEGSSQAPTTNIITSVVTQSATSNGVTDTNPVTVVITSVNTPSTTNIVTAAPTSGTSSASATSSAPAALQNSGGSGGDGSSGGLSTAGKTAIAVVIPVVAVAIAVAFGIWFWRKRKQNKDTREQRQKEIDEYGYNPNNDPTLPAVASEGGAPQMTEDSNSGYRGWGAVAGAASNRKASTTLSGGHTQGQLSDSGNSYGHSPGSPGAQYSDGHSGDPLVNQRDTMGSDDLGALGAAPAASSNQQGGIRRGPSNASSAYSTGARSEGSDEQAPPMPSYNPATGYGYGQHGPYGDGSYGGGQDNGMPVVRDVSARRNTRIQPGGNYQPNSGIAQNF